MQLKEVDRSSVIAWSPSPQHATLLAAGTVAGALDDTFSASAVLEIFSLNLSDPGLEMPVKGSLSASYRFRRLAWSNLNTSDDSFPLGLLAGGMDNGAVNIWNPHKIINSVEDEDPLLSTVERHGGPVLGLDFNPFQQNFLASGATDSEIFIWDLNNPKNPNIFSPGSQRQQTSNQQDITCIQWNRKVQHILASTSSTGASVIWDLKAKRPVISFSDPSRRVTRCRTLAWSPEVATHIIAAAEDDSYPVLQMWDLRNTISPMKELLGHQKGVLSISWCPSDASLLLSCGKDDQTLCWDPNTGEYFAVTQAVQTPSSRAMDSANVFPGGSHWNFDLQWSPRVPAVFSTSSFEGKLKIHSLQDVSGSSDYIVGGTGRPLLNAPRWLRRPCGATFGFGGKIVVFNNPTTATPAPGHPTPPAPKRTVSVYNVVTEIDFTASAEELLEVLTSEEKEGKIDFCAKRNALAKGVDSTTWSIMQILLEESTRQRLCDHYGFSKEALEKQLEAALVEGKAVPEQEVKKEEVVEKVEEVPEEVEVVKEVEKDVEEETIADPFANLADQDDDPFAQITQTPDPATAVASDKPDLSVKLPSTFSVCVPHTSKMIVDEVPVNRAVIAGKFELAVDALIKANRLVDALLIASCGGAELWEYARKTCISLRNKLYLGLASSIQDRDLEAIISTIEVENWAEAICLAATFAQVSEFPKLCKVMAERLKDAGIGDGAISCFMCSGALDEVSTLWLNANDLSIEKLGDDRQALCDLVEKICMYQYAAQIDTLKGKDGHHAELVIRALSIFGGMLAEQGRFKQAWWFLSRDDTFLDMNHAILRDRVYQALSRQDREVLADAAPNFPFSVENVGVCPSLLSSAPSVPAVTQKTTTTSWSTAPAQQPPVAPQRTVSGNQYVNAPPHGSPSVYAPPPVQRESIPAQPHPAVVPTMFQPPQPQVAPNVFQPQPPAQPQPPVPTRPQQQPMGMGQSDQYPPAPAPGTPGYQPYGQQPTPPITNVPRQTTPTAPVKEQEKHGGPEALPVIQAVILSTIEQCRAGLSTQPQQLRQIDDAAKRMDELFVKLEADTLPAYVVNQLNDLAAALSRRDFGVAHGIHVDLAKAYTQGSRWVVGIRRLVEKLKQL